MPTLKRARTEVSKNIIVRRKQNERIAHVLTRIEVVTPPRVHKNHR